MVGLLPRGPEAALAVQMHMRQYFRPARPAPSLCLLPRFLVVWAREAFSAFGPPSLRPDWVTEVRAASGLAVGVASLFWTLLIPPLRRGPGELGAD